MVGAGRRLSAASPPINGKVAGWRAGRAPVGFIGLDNRLTVEGVGKNLCTSPHGEPQRMRGRLQCCATSSDNENWAKEMDTFRKRTLKSNQLAALRQIEEKDVDIGKVLTWRDGLAVVEGLNNDAPNGASLEFANGAKGVLLWRRSDNLCFALVLEGTVAVDEPVKCAVQGIIQLVDESQGASTKREYKLMRIPSGSQMLGRLVDFLGHVPETDPQPDMEKSTALLNEQVDMQSREPISEPLLTGSKAVDIITPIGRGQNILLCGPMQSGKTSLALDLVLGQKGSDVQCVYASIATSSVEFDTVKRTLEQGGAMDYTSLVSCGQDSGLGEQYGVACAACSIAERIRDSGGHALVVIDTLKPMIELWELMNQALGEVGLEALALVDSEENSESDSSSGSFDLVEYEGMLISATAAQRRRFFSSLVQRSAKVTRVLGGGTLTLVAVLPGVPAKGYAATPEEEIAKYQNVTEAQKAKLLAALKAKQETKSSVASNPGELQTEVIEEFMSISDGQIVLKQQRNEDGGVAVDVFNSISRIGSRAYHPALESIAPQIRFQLAQAEDARQFASDPDDPLLVRLENRAQKLEAALSHSPGSVASLESQVIQLLALNEGLLDDVETANVSNVLEGLVAHVCRNKAEEVGQLIEKKTLTEKLKYELIQSAKEFVTR